MHESPAQGCLSVEDYLSSELLSPGRREFVGGFAYARTDTRNVHNRIATDVLCALGLRSRGVSCQAFNSNTKVRIRLSWEVRFYYPDAIVTCRPSPPDDVFLDEPAVIVEVVSPETRRIDEGEKLLAYQAIPSLGVYLLVEQDSVRVVAIRRAGTGFIREVHMGRDAVVPLPEIGCELPLAKVYERVEFVAS